MINSSASDLPAFAMRLRGFIQQSLLANTHRRDDAGFDLLAKDLFALQFRNNAPYRKFCESRNVTSLKSWRDIPAMPTSAFKELEMTSLAAKQRTRVFHSSGTTEHRPSRHFHNAESLAIYETSLVPWFEAHLLKDVSQAPRDFVFLTPLADDAPNSSLVHMFETIRQRHPTANSLFAGRVHDGVWEMDANKVLDTMQSASAARRPVLLFGTAFNFVHLLDHLEATSVRLRLPPGSRVMETGGYKGRSRALPKEELHALITRLLGVPANYIACEYGMSELSSQAYDCVAGGSSARVFQFPPWARAQIISPETGREVAEGETGLIRILDLANVFSVMAIQTEDMGVRRGEGFQLLGRAAMAEARGCSLASA